MANERRTIGDYVTLRRGTTYNGSLVGEQGPALLGLGSIEPGGGFRHDSWKTYGGECPSELMLAPGDLYVALKGATKDGQMIGSVARVPDSIPAGRLTQDTVKLALIEPGRSMSIFLYWLLRTPQYRQYCGARAIGSANVALARRDFLSYPVPPLTETRQRIVEILETVEAKIELNRKMSRTLDEMAQVAFEHLLQGEGTSARLDAVVSLVRDSVAPSDVAPETPYVGLEHFDGGSTFLSRWDSADKVTSGKSRFQAGDILFGKLRPYFHKVVLATFDGICSTDIMVLRPVNDAYRHLALGYVNGEAFIARASAQSEGTRMPRTKWGDVAAYEIVLPPVASMGAINSLTDPIRQRQAVCVRESLTLAEIRDALLPGLLSDEVRVRDAESIVEEAV